MEYNNIKISKKKYFYEPSINIPFYQNSNLVGRSESIMKEYVEKEIERHINPSNYEEFFLCAYEWFSRRIIFNINRDINGFYEQSKLYDLGLTYEEVVFNENKFNKTYLEFEYFTTDDIKTQTKIGGHRLYLKIIDEYYKEGNLTTRNRIKDLSECDLMFISHNPLLYTDKDCTGFNFYIDGEFCGIDNLNELNEVFVRITLNSAVDGKTYYLTTSNDNNVINVINEMHLKYNLNKTDGYTSSYNINDTIPYNETVTINLKIIKIDY